jgi:NitT/TauT family transport system substrate-binding protein
MGDKTRKKQMSAFLRGYNEACDSINQFGVQHYKDVIRKRYKVSEQALKQLPNLKYSHAVVPREKDIEAARQWLSKK